MKREATIGTATFLTIAAVVGFSLQTGPKQEGTGRSDRNGAVTRPRPSAPRSGAHRERPGCSSLQDELQEFLDIKEPILPGQCYEPRDAAPRKPPQDLAQKTSELKFVIALLPDPVHTHLSVLFDQFAVAIQEAAQDEKYDFDSSWLLWDDDDSHYALFADVRPKHPWKNYQPLAGVEPRSQRMEFTGNNSTMLRRLAILGPTFSGLCPP
jgi:hypothetical protein